MVRRHRPDHHRELLGLRQRRHLGQPDDQPTCSTTAKSSSSVGSYPSSCSGAVDTNYAITYKNGSVTVTAASLTITASSGTMTYGGSVPAITASYAGFVNGDRPVQPHNPADLLHRGYELQPGRQLLLELLGRGRSGLHHQLHRRHGRRADGAPGHHRVERLDDIRRHRPDDHAELHRLRQRRHRGSPRPRADAAPRRPPCSSPVGSYASSCSACGRRTTPSATSPARSRSTRRPDHHRQQRLDDIRRHRPDDYPSYAGFVNGETAASLTTQPTCSTTATSSSPVGSYPSSCSGARSTPTTPSRT
jgi:hypothetical protein